MKRQIIEQKREHTNLKKKNKHIKSTIGYALKYAADHIERLCKINGVEPTVSPEVYLDVQLTIEEIERQGAMLICNRG